MIPIYIPIIVTVVGFLWVLILGRLIPGPVDEGVVILLTIGTWLVYGFTNFISTSFTSLFGAKLGNFIFIAAAVTLVALYVKLKHKK